MVEKRSALPLTLTEWSGPVQRITPPVVDTDQSVPSYGSPE